MTSPAPELAYHGLALWRLRQASDRFLRCVVGGLDDKLVLTIRTDDRVLLVESHGDIGDLVARADSLKAAFLSQGWTEFDGSRDDTPAVL